MSYIHVPLTEIDETHRSAVPDIRAATDESGARVDPAFLRGLLRGYGAAGGGIAGPTNTHDGFYNEYTGKVVVFDKHVWRKMKSSVLNGLNVELNAHSEITKATFSDAPIRKNAGTPAPLIKGIMKTRNADSDELDRIVKRALGENAPFRSGPTNTSTRTAVNWADQLRHQVESALEHLDPQSREAARALLDRLSVTEGPDSGPEDDDPEVGGTLQSGAGFNRRTMSVAVGSTSFARAMKKVLQNPHSVDELGKVRR